VINRRRRRLLTIATVESRDSDTRTGPCGVPRLFRCRFGGRQQGWKRRGQKERDGGDGNEWRKLHRVCLLLYPGPAGLGATAVCLSPPGTVKLSPARAAFITHKNFPLTVSLIYYRPPTFSFARQTLITRGAHERECCDRAKRKAPKKVPPLRLLR
jgi:hypothetical protein